MGRFHPFLFRRQAVLGTQRATRIVAGRHSDPLNREGILVEECNMSVKPTLLVAALAAAALVSVGCEQRGTGTTAKSDQSTTAKIEAKTSQAAEKIEAKTSQAADKVATAADDTAITAKVKAAILAEPGLKSLQINVDTKDATVTLSGNVSSDQMRDRAKQIAMSTEGVKNVVDNLSVKTS
jgi:hyperosmotically inducible protein